MAQNEAWRTNVRRFSWRLLKKGVACQKRKGYKEKPRPGIQRCGGINTCEAVQTPSSTGMKRLGAQQQVGMEESGRCGAVEKRGMYETKGPSMLALRGIGGQWKLFPLNGRSTRARSGIGSQPLAPGMPPPCREPLGKVVCHPQLELGMAPDSHTVQPLAPSSPRLLSYGQIRAIGATRA